MGTTSAQLPRTRGATPPLLRAGHLGPSVAVTSVVALLALGEHLPAVRGVVVTTAVLAGQLTIGWGNDLVDAARDRQVGRLDKPLASGEVTAHAVRVSLIAAGLAGVVLSLLVGWRSAAVNLGLGVGSGHLYNLGLKSTSWSWVPYAVAFGTLPAVVTSADVPHHWPPLWEMAAAASLGVAAHFLNALPDFADDAATGVEGLPHLLGATLTRGTAIGLLVVASVVAALGPTGAPAAYVRVSLGAVALLSVAAATGRDKVPFGAAVAIALVDVLLLTVVSR